ncbi:MAG: hypothetical protein JWN46_1846 [Acidimicrobiales bacterium]|jgi:cell division septum initiation protein DivIVA|nr:hypothetical protein [Acidimicrobiales bacterium]
MDDAPVRAYDRVAVDAYLARVEDEKGRLRDEIVLAHRREAAAAARILHTQNGEQALGRMLVEAQRTVAGRVSHAAESARAILLDAENEVRRILGAVAAAPQADQMGRGAAVWSGPASPPHSDAAEDADPVASASAEDELWSRAFPDDPAHDEAVIDLDPEPRPDEESGIASRARSGGLRLRRQRTARRQSLAATEAADPFSDPFLATLREALTDDAPLGPRFGTI